MATVPATTYTTIRRIFEYLNLYTEQYAEAVGTGDATTTVFNLANKKAVTGTDVVYLAGVSTTAYTIDADLGKITFTSAPGSGVAITADYWYGDIFSSVVGNYINRAEKEIDQRLGRTYFPQVTINEFYSGEGNDAINPFNFEPLSFKDSMEQSYRTLNENQVWDRTLKLRYFPVLGVRLLSINNSIDQQYDQSNYTTDVGFGGATWLAQSFIAGNGYSLINVDALIKYNTGTASTITCALYADSGGSPTGSALASSDALTALVSGDTYYSMKRFSFATPYTLTSGTKYHLVFTSTASSATNTYMLGQGTANLLTSTATNSSTNSGSTWTKSTTTNFSFATWTAQALTYDQYRLIPAQGIIVLSKTAIGKFVRGLQNIVINYSYGSDTVPLMVQELCTKMAVIYTIHTRLLGSPVPLNIPKANIKTLEEDVESLWVSLGRAIEVDKV